jgi:D-3-phosphoglycerate dehydrogenase / 2-oxoglutarate reductase
LSHPWKTARYNLLDRDVVLKALDYGNIKGLTLDAFDREPPEDWSLVTHKNVLATSHVGSYTIESIERATWQVVKNLTDNIQ